jgi:hypothetical protein
MAGGMFLVSQNEYFSYMEVVMMGEDLLLMDEILYEFQRLVKYGQRPTSMCHTIWMQCTSELCTSELDIIDLSGYCLV